MTEPTRAPSPLDQLADRFVDEYAADQPTVATYAGVAGHDDRWPDYSPDGRAATAELIRRTVAEVRATDPVDRRDEVARSAMLERLGAELALHDAGWTQASLNTIESPLQELRSTFDLMPTGTEQDWATITRRIAAIPAALEGLTAGPTDAAGRGRVSAARQVRLTAGIARRWTGGDGRPGFYEQFVSGATVPAALRADLDRAATGAGAALSGFADVLERDLLPRAPEADGVGRERYALESRYFTGIDLDLE